MAEHVTLTSSEPKDSCLAVYIPNKQYKDLHDCLLLVISVQDTKAVVQNIAGAMPYGIDIPGPYEEDVQALSFYTIQEPFGKTIRELAAILRKTTSLGLK